MVGGWWHRGEDHGRLIMGFFVPVYFISPYNPAVMANYITSPKIQAYCWFSGSTVHRLRRALPPSKSIVKRTYRYTHTQMKVHACSPLLSGFPIANLYALFTLFHPCSISTNSSYPHSSLSILVSQFRTLAGLSRTYSK